MKISVTVVPKSSRLRISEQDGGLKVHLTKPAEDGKANKQLIDALSDYYKLPPCHITIVNGETSRRKIVEII